jgi:hypothetical protein
MVEEVIINFSDFKRKLKKVNRLYLKKLRHYLLKPKKKKPKNLLNNKKFT